MAWASNETQAGIWTRHVRASLRAAWAGPGLRLRLPGRLELRLGPDTPSIAVTVRRWRAFARILLRGDLGVAEGYLAGDWDCPELARLLTTLADNYDLLRTSLPTGLLRAPARLAHRLRRNTRRGARRNILAHYDLGNDFYAAWLDAGMTYSAGLFDGDESLEVAQGRKFARMAELARIAPGSRVLEIGCGWGGFAEYAAGALGAEVTGLTLSPAQRDYAERRLGGAQRPMNARVALCDYRDAAGTYDAVVSIEMFEAVGEAYWPLYFQTLAERLAPTGRAALQVITIADAHFDDYRRRPDFIQLQVFPGGMLPSAARLRQEIAAAGLEVESWTSHGADYARTLAMWRERFEAAWAEIAKLGFDARFRRLWRYYLAYCEAGFATGRTDVVQIGLRHRSATAVAGRRPLPQPLGATA